MSPSIEHSLLLVLLFVITFTFIFPFVFFIIALVVTWFAKISRKNEVENYNDR